MGKKNQKPRARLERQPSVAPVSSSVRPPPVLDTMRVPAAPVPSGGQAAAPAAPGRKASGRGAAHWVARHAERRAREAADRLRDPPRPGSARATLRTPDQAERIKARIGELHAALGRVRALRKNLGSNFYELGRVLAQIAEQKLFDAKGYASFEAFVEREIDLSKSVALKLTRLPEIFQERAAREHGMEALLGALDALESTLQPTPKKGAPARGALPLKPPK